MSIIPLFKAVAAWLLSGMMFYFCLGFSAMIINMTDIEDKAAPAAIILILFGTPAFVLLVVGIRFLMTMRKDSQRSGY